MSFFRDHSNCVFAPFFSTVLRADPTERQQKEVSFLARVFASMNRLTSLSLQRTVRVQMVKLLLSVTFLRSLLPWLSHGRRSCPRNLQRKQVSPTDLFNFYRSVLFVLTESLKSLPLFSRPTKGSFIPGKGIREHESFDQLIAAKNRMSIVNESRQLKSY